jgi:DNA-binding transcriptional MerR regulator
MSGTESGKRAAVAERRNRAIKLKNTGLSWWQVAEAMDYRNAAGEPDPAKACVDVSRALKQQISEMRQNLEELVLLADHREDDLRRKLNMILSTRHPLVQGGKLVKDDDGEQVYDLAPHFAAIDRLIKLEEKYAQRHGLNAPEKLQVALERRTDVEAAVVAEAILAGFDAANLAPQERMLALEAAQSHLHNRDTVIEGEVITDTGDEGSG